MPAEYYGQRSFPTRIAEERRTRESVLLYLYNIIICWVYEHKKVGPRAGGRLSLRAGRVAAAVPDSPARLKVTRMIFIITIRRRHTIIHHMRSYNRERVGTYARIDVGYSRNIYCNLLFFPYIYLVRGSFYDPLARFYTFGRGAQ